MGRLFLPWAQWGYEVDCVERERRSRCRLSMPDKRQLRIIASTRVCAINDCYSYRLNRRSYISPPLLR